MADDDPNQLKGSSCTATLDLAARTLTFDHRGWFRSKPQKASPVVVPLDEITGVEYDFGVITGWFRISRRGHEPWTGGVASDPHGLNSPVDPTDFAKRVQAAVGLDSRTLVSEAPEPEPAPEPTEDAKDHEPEKPGAVTKAVDGVLTFLSKWPG
jgi:hypothetical protein